MKPITSIFIFLVFLLAGCGGNSSLVRSGYRIMGPEESFRSIGDFVEYCVEYDKPLYIVVNSDYKEQYQWAVSFLMRKFNSLYEKRGNKSRVTIVSDKGLPVVFYRSNLILFGNRKNNSILKKINYKYRGKSGRAFARIINFDNGYSVLQIDGKSHKSLQHCASSVVDYHNVYAATNLVVN
ncbi:MAG: hypothetical protein ACLFQK_07660 [Fibrobacterota bacterium]